MALDSIFIFYLFRNTYIVLQLEIMLFKTSKVAPDTQEHQHSQSQIISNPQNLGTGVCRICWEQDKNMIKPCACTGSIQLVHQKCMVSWVEAQHKSQKNNIQCQICLEQIKFRYKTKYEWKPDKCDQNVDKINPCYLGLFLGSIVFLIIFSIVLKFGQSSVLQGTGKYIIISGVVIMSGCFILLAIILFFILFTDKKYVIQEILDRNAKIRSFSIVPSDSSNAIQANISSNYTSSVSSSAVPA